MTSISKYNYCDCKTIHWWSTFCTFTRFIRMTVGPGRIPEALRSVKSCGRGECHWRPIKITESGKKKKNLSGRLVPSSRNSHWHEQMFKTTGFMFINSWWTSTLVHNVMCANKMTQLRVKRQPDELVNTRCPTCFGSFRTIFPHLCY